MTKLVLFPNLVSEMARRGERQEDLAEVLSLTRTSVNRKLLGKVKWTKDEIDKVCEHYNKDYNEIFK